MDTNHEDGNHGISLATYTKDQLNLDWLESSSDFDNVIKAPSDHDKWNPNAVPGTKSVERPLDEYCVPCALICANINAYHRCFRLGPLPTDNRSVRCTGCDANNTKKCYKKTRKIEPSFSKFIGTLGKLRHTNCLQSKDESEIRAVLEEFNEAKWDLIGKHSEAYHSQAAEEGDLDDRDEEESEHPPKKRKRRHQPNSNHDDDDDDEGPSGGKGKGPSEAEAEEGGPDSNLALRRDVAEYFRYQGQYLRDQADDLESKAACIRRQAENLEDKATSLEEHHATINTNTLQDDTSYDCTSDDNILQIPIAVRNMVQNCGNTSVVFTGLKSWYLETRSSDRSLTAGDLEGCWEQFRKGGTKERMRDAGYIFSDRLPPTKPATRNPQSEPSKPRGHP